MIFLPRFTKHAANGRNGMGRRPVRIRKPTEKPSLPSVANTLTVPSRTMPPPGARRHERPRDFGGRAVIHRCDKCGNAKTLSYRTPPGHTVPTAYHVCYHCARVNTKLGQERFKMEQAIVRSEPEAPDCERCGHPKTRIKRHFPHSTRLSYHYACENCRRKNMEAVYARRRGLPFGSQPQEEEAVTLPPAKIEPVDRPEPPEPVRDPFWRSRQEYWAAERRWRVGLAIPIRRAQGKPLTRKYGCG
jgi:hypothetical protein